MGKFSEKEVELWVDIVGGGDDKYLQDESLLWALTNQHRPEWTLPINSSIAGPILTGAGEYRF